MSLDKFSRPWYGVNRKVADDDKNHLYKQFHPKLMTHSAENAQKPHLLKNCILLGTGYVA